jgi:predicted TIM-barrel fold metal-dependent hydrolase
MTIQLPREKWENLPGGLANAIKQAKEREFEKMFIFDSDCHQSEPFRAMAKYVDDPLRNLLLSPDPEEDPFQARLARMYAAETHMDDQYYMAGVKLLKRPETSLTRANWQLADELIRIHTELMHDIGIKGSIILPTSMLRLAIGSPRAEVTVAKAYINYMLDNFLGKYPEMNTLIYVPTQSPDKAVELIDKFGHEKGVLGIMISAASSVNAGSDLMDPIYEACTSKQLPVCVHGHRNAASPDMKFLGEHALTFPMSLIRHLTSVILNGVPVCYPKLKFVFMEGGVTWIPWIRARLDDEYTKRRIEAPLLTKLPSEYMKDFYYTSQPLEQSHMEGLPPIFDMMDFENHLLYASDYPHWDFDVPSVIYDLPFLSETVKKKILGENAKRLFGLGN